MPILKVPANMTGCSTSTGHVFEVVNGFIDTENAPGKAVAELLAQDGVTEATEEDIAAADMKTVMAPAVEHIKNSRAELKAELLRRGIVVDGRASLASMEAALRRATAAETPAPAEAAQPAVEPDPETGADPTEGDDGSAAGTETQPPKAPAKAAKS